MNNANKKESEIRNSQHVQSIAGGLEFHDIKLGDECENCGHEITEDCIDRQECSECEHNPNSAMDWLEGALDINYIINSDMTFKAARVLVAFGGPNIWVDFHTNRVELNWWGESASCEFIDEIGVLEMLEELYDCN